MKKGLILLFAFILAALFSAEIFAGEVKTNFGVKKREKKVVEQRLIREKAKETHAKKIPVAQPVTETAIATTANAPTDADKNITAEVYVSKVKTNFGVKKREKQAVAQRAQIEMVKATPVEKVPPVQPLAEAAVVTTTAVAGVAKNTTDAMYNDVVDAMMGKMDQIKQERASGKTRVAAVKPQEMKQVYKQTVTQMVSETKLQESKKIAQAPQKKERIKKEVEPKRRRSSNIK